MTISRETITKFGAAVFIAAVSYGCSKSADTVSQAPHAMPIFKVDAEHSHVSTTKVTAEPPLYEMYPGNQFILDLNKFPVSAVQNGEKADMVIEVAGEGMQALTVPITPDKQKYTITTPVTLKSGQKFIVGLGAAVLNGKKIDFYPSWVGMVKVN